MGFRAIEPVQITGLTSAANTDFSAGWNTNVNIGTFTTIPPPATAVLFYVVNDSTSSQSMGLRHANNSSNIAATTSFGGGRFQNFIATLEGPSNTYFQFHTNSNTAIKFFVAGFFHDITVLEPQNTITKSITVGTFQTKTMNELPNGTTFIINTNSRGSQTFNNRWRSVGGTTEYPFYGSLTFVAIDNNKEFQANVDSSGSVNVIGYGSGNWVKFVSTLTGNSMANTVWSANSNWNDYPTLYPNVTGVVPFLDRDGVQGWNTGASAFFRKKGASWSIARAGAATTGGFVVNVDSSGTFQYWIESGVANNGSIAVATYFTESVPDYTLTDVNTTEQVSAGDSGIVFTGRGLSSVNKIRITSGTKFVNTAVTSASNNSVISNIPTDSDIFNANVAFGNVTFSLEVSGNVVANLDGQLTLSQEYISHTISDVSQNTNQYSIYYGQYPILTTSDKLAVASKTETQNWQTTVDSKGFIVLDTNESKVSDNLSYKVYYTASQEWIPTQKLQIVSPYINANVTSKRVIPSNDGKRYSKYPNGNAP